MINYRNQIKNIFDKNREVVCPAFLKENEKRAPVSESPFRVGSCIPALDNRVYTNKTTANCQVAEGGGNDPQLRNSPSIHNNSITRKLFMVQQSNARKRNLEDE